MSSRHTFVRQLAVWLAAHAAQVLPLRRADWASAIRNEVHHITGNQAALRWAVGCVFASYFERMRTMIESTQRISRWVLVVEMLCFFTPLTLLCFAVLGNLNLMTGQEVILGLTGAAAGPAGLIIAFKIVVLNRPSLTKSAMTTLAILAVWTLFGYSLQLLSQGGVDHWWSFWREFVLIALLPAIGSAHLIYLASRSARNAPAR
jgi:hypothetical protein